MNHESPTALLYLRVSTQRQLRTDFGPEGLSIPAQRAACTQTAEREGITVAEEYIEPGRSGKSIAGRPILKQVLERAADPNVTHLIVYELSRLARNRADDVQIVTKLAAHGVTLISATENVDATPVGQLTHGLLAAVNEYRSARDGADVAYKMKQKVEQGGTIGRAPIGYLNTIERRDGSIRRGIALDPGRAPLVCEAFTAFATDRYSYEQLRWHLFDRGLTRRTRQGEPAQPLSVGGISRLLSNRYYLGVTVYGRTERPGLHKPLVTSELFDRVAETLARRHTSRQRRRRHDHYLKGLLCCIHCLNAGYPSSLLRYTETARRSGQRFRYFYCAVRSTKDCHTYLPALSAEQHLVAIWTPLRLTLNYRALLQKAVRKFGVRIVSDYPLHQYLGAENWIRRHMNGALFEQVYPPAQRSNHA